MLFFCTSDIASGTAKSETEKNVETVAEPSCRRNFASSAAFCFPKRTPISLSVENLSGPPPARFIETLNARLAAPAALAAQIGAVSKKNNRPIKTFLRIYQPLTARCFVGILPVSLLEPWF